MAVAAEKLVVVQCVTAFDGDFRFKSGVDGFFLKPSCVQLATAGLKVVKATPAEGPSFGIAPAGT